MKTRILLKLAVVCNRIRRRCPCSTSSVVIFRFTARVLTSVTWGCAVLWGMNCLAQPRHLGELGIRQEIVPVNVGGAALLLTFRQEPLGGLCVSSRSSFSPSSRPRTYWDPRSRQRSARKTATSCLVCPIERPVDRIDELFPRNPAATQRICLKPPPKSLPFKTTARIR